MDLIVGIHSIAEAIRNPKREVYTLVGTDEGFKELYKRGGIDPKLIGEVDQHKFSNHDFQEHAKREFKKRDLNYQRIPSGIYATTSVLKIYEVKDLMNDIQEGKRLKILALDQVTDTHNAAAILRTAAFYGVDYLLTAVKGAFGMTPSFYRIASGATEHVRLVQAASLPKLLNKLVQKDVSVIGLSEHASDDDLSTNTGAVCLVLGAEDVGMSNAVARAVTKTIALKSHGEIKSLNVSVAGAVAMERVFN